MRSRWVAVVTILCQVNSPTLIYLHNTSQLKLHEFSSAKSKFSSNSQKSQNITKATASYLACDMRPISSKENNWFWHLIRSLEPELYTKVKKRIVSDNYKAHFIFVFTYGWTSRTAHSYVTITVHFIYDNFEIQNHTLQTRQLNSSHTASWQLLLMSGASKNLNPL